jgi:hypothetical protein
VILAAGINRGGAILVRIEDEDGRGLAGQARFHGVRRGGKGADTGFQDVGENGSLISGFEPVPGRVEAMASGRPRIFPSEKLGSMPRDEDLVGRSEILPQAIVARNEQAAVTLRYEKVGYVRGRLTPPKGRTPQEYRVNLGSSHYRKGAGVFYKPDTGEFLAGPFRSGEVALTVSAGLGFEPFFQQEVSVRAGEVSEAILRITTDAEKATRRLPSVNGRIWLADGATVAGLATVARWNPGDQHPWRIGMTDSGGFIRKKGYMYRSYGDEFEPDPEGTPREPVYLAWQPGRCGATIVPVPKDIDHSLAMTLPPPLSLRGNVIVSGDGDTVNNRTITVRAQYEGRGMLDDLLSVETMAGADGVFELAGLTPGKYRVQAALDGIWLSSSIEFTAGEGPPQPPVTLTIQPPGGPVLVRLSGERKGSPEKLILRRPTGPLSDRLWPKHVSADGAGVFRIPALEAGKHLVRIGDHEKVVDVPSLTESKGRPTEVELRLEK